ncbi:MAG: hypothetical protein M9887_10230 [Chitinophagales bacterium]|nr:hypothetical protein [Chitinophagales bacterium]
MHTLKINIMTKAITLLGLSFVFFIACKTSRDIFTNQKTQNNQSDMNNPFFKESTLPFNTIDFDKIKVADFAPAFEEGMKLQMEEIDKIAIIRKYQVLKTHLWRLKKVVKCSIEPLMPFIC